MAGPKAITTVYNGFKFRSRLEARWAVFMDTVGVQYEYEKEGYDLGKHGYYLPDFWLPVLNAWLEIKPGNTEDYAPLMNKAGALAELTQAPCFVIVGQPWFPDTDPASCYECFALYPDSSVGNGYWWSECSAEGCGRIGLSYHGNTAGLPCFGTHQRIIRFRDWPGYYGPTLSAGYERARQARFEFGEKG